MKKQFCIKESPVTLAKKSANKIIVFLEAIRFEKAAEELIELHRHINEIRNQKGGKL